MDRLAAIQVFIEVADRGSLTQAADRLGLSRAMVSRHLAGLEQWLGARLLHRTTRRISLSDAGMEALQRFRLIAELAAETQAATGSRRREAVGKLRVTTSLSFAEAELTAAVVAFQATHPGVTIELIASDHALNLIDQRIDLAVRITNQLDEGFVARPLARCRSVLCAAPAYLQRHGIPTRPEQLAEHNCITHAYGSRAEYRLAHQGESLRIAVSGTLFSNETAVLREAALAGAGIAMLPTYYVASDLRAGTLQALLTEYEPQPMGIHAVYLSRQHPPLALRLLIEFLVERFGGENAPWDAPLAPALRQSESSPPGRASRATRRR